MKSSVYLETTIPSYLTAREGGDLIFRANRQLTIEWWQTQRDKYELFVSQFVLDEASAGDQKAAARRLDAIRDLPLLSADKDCRALASVLVAKVPIPPKAAADALHLAVAAINGIDYLLTWNCTHLANAALRSRIELVCERANVEAPVICTPQELMES